MPVAGHVGVTPTPASRRWARTFDPFRPGSVQVTITALLPFGIAENANSCLGATQSRLGSGVHAGLVVQSGAMRGPNTPIAEPIRKSTQLSCGSAATFEAAKVVSRANAGARRLIAVS